MLAILVCRPRVRGRFVKASEAASMQAEALGAVCSTPIISEITGMAQEQAADAAAEIAHLTADCLPFTADAAADGFGSLALDSDLL